MKIYKVCIEQKCEKLKEPYNSSKSYYIKDGQWYFDMIIYQDSIEIEVESFNKEAILNLYKEEIFNIISIELINEKETIFDKLEKIAPNRLTINKSKIVSTKELYTKNVETINPNLRTISEF